MTDTRTFPDPRPGITTLALVQIAAALQTFLAEKTYAQQVNERAERLAKIGLDFSPEELK